MAKTTKAVTSDKKTVSKSDEPKSWKMSKQKKIVLGSFLVLFSIALLLAFISFYISGQTDQSAVTRLSDRSEIVENWLGKFGAFLADLIVYKGFGVA
jgi:S-DNA-T family DNA segregation ATPase FtsK/SpoIIIE